MDRVIKLLRKGNIGYKKIYSIKNKPVKLKNKRKQVIKIEDEE